MGRAQGTKDKKLEPETEPQEDFYTTNVDLSSYLLASGAELLRVLPPTDDTPPRLAVFHFDNTNKLAHELSRWLGDEPVSLQPRGLLAKRRHLYRLAKEAVQAGTS